MRVAFRLSLIVAGVLLATEVSAYPISPVTLWGLVQSADLIVLARVADVVPIDPPDDDTRGPDRTAVLDVIETWKGPALSTVRVPFAGRFACPAPPSYIEDEEVVAFLFKDDEGWTTVALSYGTRYAEPAEVPVLRQRVAEAIAVQSKKEPSPRERLDWLLRAASHPVTRWDGLYELLPAAARVPPSYERSERPEGFALSVVDKTRIVDGFKRHPQIDFSVPLLLAAIEPYEDPEIDELIVAAIETLAGQDQPLWWTYDVVQSGLERLGLARVEQRMDLLDDWWKQPDVGKLRRLWEQAKRELDIGEVSPDWLRRIRLPGTEADPPG